MKKYLVKVNRPVIQSIVIEVEAEDGEQAVHLAAEKTAKVPEERWSGRDRLVTMSPTFLR